MTTSNLAVVKLSVKLRDELQPAGRKNHFHTSRPGDPNNKEEVVISPRNTFCPL